MKRSAAEDIHVRNEPTPFAQVPEALIFDRTVSAEAKILWCALRRRGVTPERCFPGIEHLAKRLGVASRTVRRWLDELCAEGWVEVVHRFDEDGRQTSNGYFVRIAKVTSVSMAPDTDVTLPLTSVSPSGVTSVSPKRESVEREPSKETSPLPPDAPPSAALAHVEASLPAPRYGADFERFWINYPQQRRQGKGAAAAEFVKALKRADAETITAAALRLATDPNLPTDDPKFIPLASTWLHQSRWDDGPLPRRTRRKVNTADLQELGDDPLALDALIASTQRRLNGDT